MTRRILAALLVTVLVAPASALAGTDATPPVGTVEVVHDDRDAGLIRLSVPATDDVSGVATVEVSGDGTTWASFAYAPEVDWSVFDPASGGDPDLGDRTVRVRWTDGVGNTSSAVTTTLYLSRNGALEYPDPPVTGELFTIRPIYGPGQVPGPNADCSWELRWGDTTSLKNNDFNWTFGSIFMQGDADRGFCGEWTFSLPSVPVPQFEIYTNSRFGGAGDEEWPERARFYPATGSDDRRIRSSNIPLVHVIPNTERMVVGEPITYTAYPIGTTLKDADIWMVFWPNFDPPPGGTIDFKRQYGGKTFTFTPVKTGNWLVTWSGRNRPIAVGATYDPKARNPDNTAPKTSAPKQRIGGGTPGANVPVTLEWSGSDEGWGIERFRLQRSVDGGSWQSVGLSKPRAKSIVLNLSPGHAYQFRVRAIDEAGNAGAWDTGPKFKPKIVGNTSSAITYGDVWSEELDATALDGSLHQSDAAGASAVFEFVGRDIAWVAEKGPGKGSAKVYVDGDLIATINLQAGSDVARAIVFRKHWSTASSHRIRIVVEATGPLVTLDAFAVLR